MSGCPKTRSAALLRAFAGLLLVACISTYATAQGWDTTLVPPAPAKPTLKSKPTPVPVLQTGSVPPLPAAEPKPATEAPAAQVAARPRKPDAASADARPAQKYCVNIADAAADARFAWQKKSLADIEQEVAKRITLLEEKTAEYQKWLARRDEFSKKAKDSLLSIYARMRPDAAALQFALLDEETAAALLIKLDPRNASAILSEMDPNQAARLSATIEGAAKVNPPAPARAPAGDKRS